MVGVTWKGKRSKSLTAGPGGGLRAASQPPQAVAAGPQQPPRPVISFKDKQSYQELFKPLPKPEPIPILNVVQIECKSWMQLQQERDEIIQREIEKTKMEAEGMYNRVLQDDQKRCEFLQKERDRIENEQRVREEILRKDREERAQKDEARKAEIRRQEEILANSRNMRSKTVDLTGRRDSLTGGGIQVYHYKDKVVPEIVKQTRQEELRRKNSVGFNFGTDLLASLPSSPEPSINGHQSNGQAVNGINGANSVNGMNGANGLNGVANGVNGSALNGAANGGGQNGNYEARVFPQQIKMNKLPPRPMKDSMPPSRKFQNGVDSAFMANGSGNGGQSNGFSDPSNIYKSVMGGKGYY